MPVASQALLTPTVARGRVAHRSRIHDHSGETQARADLAAANIAAAIRRETGKGYPITPDHAAALTALLVEVAA